MNRFREGQVAYYKPAAGAPLQLSAGGPCRVLRVFGGAEGYDYVIELVGQSGERVAHERELTELEDTSPA